MHLLSSCLPVPPQCCSARYNLAIMMFFGFSVVYGLRVNLSVAMVAMVNGTNSQPTLNSSVGHECPVSSHGNNNGSQTPDQPDGVSTSFSKVSTTRPIVYCTSILKLIYYSTSICFTQTLCMHTGHTAHAKYAQ